MIKSDRQVRNFWAVFFGVLAALAIALTIVTYFLMNEKVEYMRRTTIDDENVYKIQLENKYHEALYSAADSLKNIDADLGKISASDSPETETEMLMKISLHAANVNDKLGNLPVREGDVLMKFGKYANQLQDYSSNLLRKTAAGEKVCASDKKSLQSLQNTAHKLSLTLEKVINDESALYITNSLGADGTNILDDSLGEMEDNVFEYEKLIYDGPFSDNVKQKEVKTEKSVSPEESRKNLGELFFEENVSNIVFSGEMHNRGTFYAYDIETEDGSIRALMTTDGRLAEFEYYLDGTDKESTLKGEDCSKIAEEYARKLGFDVTPVWVSKTQDFVTYVNLAPVKDGVIFYPDLVKVAVDCSEGKVVGMESRAYLMNHKDRDVSGFTADESQAKKNLASTLNVVNSGKALIEKNGKEFLCYEFECETGGSQYFVYLDAATFAEKEIFKVIEGTEGYTVM